MHNKFKEVILSSTKATSAIEVELIQTLWSGYGKVTRVKLEGSSIKSVVLKNIVIPKEMNHPRGWDTDLSNQRKIKSYKIETYWYNNWVHKCNDNCRVPKCFTSNNNNEESVIVLEDLNESGYPLRKSRLSFNEVKLCIKWLANFHAVFMNEKPTGLWEIGTYWNLDTRPEEYRAMRNETLKSTAHQIDNLLNACVFKTILHGDAKVANFCFSEDSRSVAAVDFQYVGAGCGMKDYIYLLGSCLTEEECELWEEELLNYYFCSLETALITNNKKVNFAELEKEWRSLFSIAWADFARFIDGWMPSHQKNNKYSKKLTKVALDIINKKSHQKDGSKH